MVISVGVVVVVKLDNVWRSCLLRFVPPPVRGEVSWTVENFVTFRASVLHVYYHRTSAHKYNIREGVNE